MAKTKRVEWIDFVRALAILTVLYIHASDGIFIISSDKILHYTLFSRIFEFASLFIGRIGVPLFLMITGYLLIDRHYNDEKVRKFWDVNCRNLIIVTVFWTIVYAIILQIVTMNSAQVNLVESGNLMFSHMWYMPMIIGMYLSLPFVSNGLKDFDNKTIYKGVIVFSILAFCVPFISTLLDINGVKNVNIQYCLGFSGGVYGIYIILGYLVKRDKFKNVSNWWLTLITIVSFIITILFEYYTYLRGYPFLLWYEFPFILLGSFSIFELCSRIKKVKGYKVIAILSKYSFAVFLVHNLFRLPLLPYIVRLPFTEPVKTIILWILLIIFSYITVYLISKIPKVGKFVLYLR